MNNNQRRRFLKLGAKTITGAGLALGTNPMLTLAQAADSNHADSADYRALVCVYLDGGSDGFSLLVPTGNAEYNEYTRSRQELSIGADKLLPLSTASGNHDAMGLYKQAEPLYNLYQDHRLALIANVGNLIVPTSRGQYEDKSVPLPLQLFSHADQEIQWQQLQGRGRGDQGWGAAAVDRLSSYQERDYLTSVTLSGSNYWQSGSDQRPFALKETGLLQFAGLDTNNSWERPRADAFRRVLGMQQTHMFSSAYSDIQNRALRITEELGGVLESNGPILTEQPEGNSLAAQFGMVAQIIAAREQLGMRRQVFYVSMKGFDMHDHQNKKQPWLFHQLAQAFSYFQSTLDEIGESDNVTTFTVSDFGRTLTGNGDGTDHGWGNHHWVMGGAVKGGDVYGSMPRMGVDGPDAIQNGRIVPTLASAQYAATLLRWMGLPEGELHQILPTLSNFQQTDLGFLT